MAEKSEQPAGEAEKDLPTPSEIARQAATDAASALKTASQFPARSIEAEQSSLLVPPITPRRRR